MWQHIKSIQELNAHSIEKHTMVRVVLLQISGMASLATPVWRVALWKHHQKAPVVNTGESELHAVCNPSFLWSGNWCFTYTLTWTQAEWRHNFLNVIFFKTIWYSTFYIYSIYIYIYIHDETLLWMYFWAVCSDSTSRSWIIIKATFSTLDTPPVWSPACLMLSCQWAVQSLWSVLPSVSGVSPADVAFAITTRCGATAAGAHGDKYTNMFPRTRDTLELCASWWCGSGWFTWAPASSLVASNLRLLRAERQKDPDSGQIAVNFLFNSNN